MVKDDEYYSVCNSHVVLIWPSKMIFVQKTDHPKIAVDFSINGLDLLLVFYLFSIIGSCNLLKCVRMDL